MPFITNANAARVITKIKVDAIDLEEALYKRRIYFFNDWERRELLSLKLLLSSPEVFAIEAFNPLEKRNGREFVFEYEGQRPSYHSDKTCHLMFRDYENIRLSSELRNNLEQRGVSIKEFRRWAYENLAHLTKKRDWGAIMMRIQVKYSVEVNREDLVQFENSDVYEKKIENYDLGKLEAALGEHLSKAGSYYFRYESVLRKFSKLSFLHSKPDPISGNNTGWTDEELKKFLKHYHEEFKRPTQKMLKEWYRLSHNPEMRFEGRLLEQLNFKPCSSCCNGVTGGDGDFDVRFDDL